MCLNQLVTIVAVLQVALCLANTETEVLSNCITVKGQKPKTVPRFRPALDQKASYTNEGGTDIERKCTASGEPKPSVLWYKDNQLLHEDGDRIIIKKWALQIKSLTYKDEGTYKCVVSNECGTIEWKFKQDVVVESKIPLPPDILLDPENITIHEGEDTSLKCLFFSTDLVTIWWAKRYTVNGSEVDENGLLYRQMLNDKIDYEGDPEILQLNNVTVNDSGTYECIIQNRYGANNRLQQLNVLPVVAEKVPYGGFVPRNGVTLPVVGSSTMANTKLIAIVVSVCATLLIAMLLGLLFKCMKRRGDSQTKRTAAINTLYPLIPVKEMDVIPDDSHIDNHTSIKPLENV